jgi:hypothetical protein
MRSTREEKISSPRGLVVGGILGIGRTADGERERIVGGGDEERGEVACEPEFERVCSFSGRGKSSERGLSINLNFERRGGLRTLRYMLKERSARLACGTYLTGLERVGA